MFSLSHWAVVALVVAAIVIAWKFERRKPKGSPFSTPKARPISIQRQLLKIVILVVLVIGALAPDLGFDEVARYVHMVCTIGLAALAYMWMFMGREN